MNIALRVLLILAFASGGALAWSCLDQVDLETHRFVCERPSDCIDGFFCHPRDLVCVPTGTSTVSGDAGLSTADASAPDSGPQRPILGERCEPEIGCRSGFCVDGYCCSSLCNGSCERCDIEPGVCRPVADGLDPDADCADQILRCAEFTCGLDGAAACRSCAEGESFGICNGAGACRPRECPVGLGVVLSECPNRACTAPDACPAGRPITDFDSTEELCDRGRSCLLSAGSGCCSSAGTCCPAPGCNAVDPACE